jgi:uncharacterized protein (DUF433 family)
MDEQLVTRSPDVLGGVPVFYGTRVPVKTLIDYISQGETIDTFLDDFPSVERGQVMRFLERVGAATMILADENSP